MSVSASPRPLRKHYLSTALIASIVVLALSLPLLIERAVAQTPSLLVTVSAASYTAPVAPESIVAAFGAGLAADVIPAGDADPQTPGIQLPTSLGGTIVEVNGTKAGLFFVSPQQINYLIPAGTAAGMATVTVKRGEMTAATGTVQVTATAPSLFAANSDARGVPAGYVVRVKPDSSQSTEAIEQFNATQQRLTARPISLGPAGDVVVLVLFGTGLRGVAAGEQVRALIDGAAVETFFAAHSVFIGLDQVNVILSRTLLGRGYHRLKVSVSERMSNELEFELALPDGSAPLPTASFDSIVLDEDTRQVVRLSGSDAEGRPLFFVVTSQPQRGSLSGSGAEREYLPASNYNGADSLTFKVNNGLADSATATVTLLVRPVNDPPTLAFQGPASVFAGEQLIFNITGTDIDGNQSLRCEAVELPNGATFAQSSATTWQVQWVPPFLRAGANEFQFRLSDDGAPPLTSSRSFTTTVNLRPIPRMPVSGTSGGEGGDVRAIHFGPDYLLVNAGSGLFRSTNEGRYWRLVYRANTTVTAIVAIGDAVIAAAGSGLLRSTTNGVRWTVLPAFPGQAINALAVSGGMLFAAANDGVFRSTDSGATWVKMSQGLATNSAYLTLAVMGTTLLTGNASSTIYRSTNNGMNWTSVSQGLTNAGRVQSFGQTAQAILAGTSTGIYRTTNSGQSWTKVHPATASLNCAALLVSGLRIYAGTNEGTFVSTDNGLTWNPLGQDRSRYRVLAENSGMVYAGDVRGFYRSGNQGQTFEASYDGIFSGSTEWITSLFVDGDVIYAANQVSGTSFDSSGIGGVAQETDNPYGRIYRSTDRGRSWEVIREVNHQNGVFFAKLGGTLFVANAPGLARLTIVDNQPRWETIGPQSTFGGRDPQLITTLVADERKVCIGGYKRIECYDQTGRVVSAYSLPDPPPLTGIDRGYVEDLTLNGDSILFHYDVGADVGNAAFGLFRVNPDGSVIQVDNGLPLYSNTNYVFARNLMASGGRLFAQIGKAPQLDEGVFISIDNGASWKFYSQSYERLTVVGGILFSNSGTGFQLSFSRDHGESWVSLGLLATPVYSTGRTVSTVGILREDQLVAGDSRGAAIYTDSNQSWSRRTTGLDNTFLNTVITNGDTLLAGTLGSGMFRSTDGGSNWTGITDGFPANANLQSIAVNGTNQFAALFGDGVYRSVNGGVSWSAVNTGLTNFFVNAVRMAGSTVFALTEGGIFRSTNNGTSWAAANAGLPPGSSTSLVTLGSTIFVGTELGVYRSVDNGQNWTASTTGLTRRIHSLGIGPDGQTLFAGTTNAGVFRSTDGGQTWAAVNNRLPARSLVTSFVVARGRLYAGTINGVFVTDDNGASWEQINTGMFDIFVTGLAAIGDRLFAGFATSGVFLSEIPR